MIDQYVYTRNDSGSNKKDYGHGLAAKTAGVTPELGSDASSISRYNNDNVDHNGNRVKIIEKRNIGGGRFIALQQSVRLPEMIAAGDIPAGDERLLYFSSTDRPQLLSHGFISDVFDDTVAMTDPDRWFYLDYIDYNVNLKMPELDRLLELPDNSTPLEPLQTVLSKAGMSVDTFITAVRASFDTENWDTIELIEVDFTRSDAKELSAQILRWLFHFLPFAMRRQADFSTCYDSGCGGHEYSLAIIPSAMLVKERGGRVTFRGMQNSARFGYIIADDTCIHQKLSGRKDFDTSGSLYARWLEGVIRCVYGEPHESGLETLKKLDGIYSALDRPIRNRPIGRQCRTETYDALIWAYLCNTVYEGEHIDMADDFARLTESPKAYIEELFSLEDRRLLSDLAPEILDDASAMAEKGVSDGWLDAVFRLTKALDGFSEGRDVLNIYLARTLDLADGASLERETERYFNIVKEQRSVLLESSFFPMAPVEPRRWALAGTDPSGSRGAMRAEKWLRGRITALDDCGRYLEQIESVLSQFSGFSQEHLVSLLSESMIPLPRFTDCGFADMAGLVGCMGRLAELFKDAPVVSDAANRFMSENVSDRILNCLEKHTAGLAVAPESIVDCLEDINSSFAPVRNDPKGAKLKLYYMEKCLNVWIHTAAEQYSRARSEGARVTFCANESGLHERMTDALLHAKETGCGDTQLGKAYQNACWFMCSDAYTHRTKKWFLDFPRINEKAASCFGARHALLDSIESISKYIGSGTLDFERFRMLIPHAGESSALRIIMDLYDRDELPELGAEMVAYYGVLLGRSKTAEDPNCAMTDAFRRLISKKGCMELKNLLDRYPSAQPGFKDADEDNGGFGGFLRKIAQKPKTDEKEYVPRTGEYPWMTVNHTLFIALEEAIKREKDRVLNEFRADEMNCPELISAVYDLAPSRSEFAANSRRVNNLLCCLWESQKPSNSMAKKAMSELKKKGAIDQSR